jgi:hypothetical protein
MVVLAMKWLGAASSAHAQSVLSRETAPTVRSELLAHFGLTNAPFEVPTLAEAKGHAFVFVGSAVYAASPQWEGEVRVPWVLGSVAQPAGSYVDATALGNPQLGVRRRLVHQSSGSAVFDVVGGMNVGVPLAQHADDLMPNRLLAIADGIDGRQHLELFTPGALPLTPAASLAVENGRWQLLAHLACPLLVRVSDAHLADHGAATRGLGFASALGVEARYRFLTWLSLASAVHLTVDLAPLAERPARASRWQDLERLSLHVRLGTRGSLVVDVQAPAGGALAGNTVAAGFRFVLDLG